jgi:autotransporter-associated beta strand protein
MKIAGRKPSAQCRCHFAVAERAGFSAVRFRSLLRGGVAVAALLAAAGGARAANISWTGGNGQWGTLGWSLPRIPTASDTVNISSGSVGFGSTFSAGTVNLSGGVLKGAVKGNLNVSTLNVSGGELTVAAPGAMGFFGTVNVSTLLNITGGTLDAGGFLNVGGSGTITQSAGQVTQLVIGTPSYTQSGGSMGGVLTTGTYALTGASATSTGGTINASSQFNLGPASGTATVDALLSGTGNLVKSGASTVILTNGLNSFSGTVAINAGTLEVASGALPANNAVTVAGGATLLLAADTDATSMGSMTGSTGSLVKQGNGTYTLGGGITLGALSVNGGELDIGTGTSTNSASFDSASIAAGATLEVASGATLTIRGSSGVVNNGSFINNGTVFDALNNTSAFDNNSAYNANVASNTGTINNNTPGVWTGNVLSNTGTINNNTGAAWNGNVATNDGNIFNAGGTWTGDVQGNGNYIENDAAWNGNVVSNAGTINNNAPGVWTGNVLTNAGTINNNGGAWNGNVATNDGNIFNAAGTWTGDVQGNSNYIENDATWNGNIVSNLNGQIYNYGTWTGQIQSNESAIVNAAGVWNGNILGNNNQIDNSAGAIWNGDIVANGGGSNVESQVNNEGTWNGNVLGNATGIHNLGAWNGQVVANAGSIVNVTDIWTGDVVSNNGIIFNIGAAWNGNVDANAGIIVNQQGPWQGVPAGPGIWTGNVASNTGSIDNETASTWNGNVATNAGTITNTGIWNGNVLSNAGIIANASGATWTGNIANAGSFDNESTLIGTLTNTAGTATNNGTITGAATISGGILRGTGSVGGLTVANGGAFSPGNGTAGSSATISGNLAFQAGGLYVVYVNAVTASFAKVTGTATLGGANVDASFAIGTRVASRYTILTVSGGLAGSSFGTVVNTNLPTGFKTALSYDADDVYLDLSLAFTAPPGTGLNANQQRVGNALGNSFSSNGSIAPTYVGLTSAGLTQVSGESATTTQQTSFAAATLFMTLLTDPFAPGRGDAAGASGGAMPFAGENAAQRSGSERDAYAAMATKALAPAVDPFAQRWSVWAADFGGSETTNGNAALGSNTATSRIFGSVVGADYRISPSTLAGFALAGGGTGFGVAGGGSGRSDLFQAGVFIKHTAGPAYIAATLAYGWQDVTSDRTVAVAGLDQLQSRFDANTYSGRIEGGYRYAIPWIGGLGVTPYAAGQFATFDLPAYAESVLSGNNAFALSYGAMSVTDVRSEVGLRTDKSYAILAAIVTLRGRVAWAHDFDPDRSVFATFQALPGASFTVNGAAPSPNAALATASAEIKWRNGFSVAATFEGEFSDVTRSYAGKGVVAYTW